MRLNNPQDLQSFNQIISPWISAYKYADCVSVAIKVGREWPLLIGRTILHFAPPEVSPLKLDTEYVRARRAVVPIVEGTASRLINSAGTGNLVINDEEFTLSQDGAQSLGSSLFPLYHPEVGGGVRIPALRIYGKNKEPLLRSSTFKPVEHLDWELKASDQPFDTFDELLLSLGLPALLKLGDSTALEVVAGNPASILDTSQIHRGLATIMCRMARGLDPAKLKLGYKVKRGSLTDRSTRMGNGFEWTEKESFQEGSIRVNVGDAPILQAFISYQDLALHQWWIMDPDKRLNLRQAVYEAFDQDLGILKAFLNGQGRDMARDFEKGVSLLTNLLGFSIVPLSIIPQLADGPDLIISTPNGHVAVVECTTRHLNEDNKLARLVRRANLLKDKLRSAGYGYLNVQPVIVTLLTRSEVQVELDEAGKYSVAVISKEGLQTLFDQAMLFSNAEELFSRLTEYIPHHGAQESLFPGPPS